MADESASLWSAKDFPGMASVCLSHSGAFYRDGDLTWRSGGSDSCVCELATDALARLRGELAWARQDEQWARERAEAIEAQITATSTAEFGPDFPAFPGRPEWLQAAFRRVHGS